MTPSIEQLPVSYDFTEEDMPNVALTPIQRCYIETRKADAMRRLANIKVDPTKIDEFLQEQAFSAGVMAFCNELLSIN